MHLIYLKNVYLKTFLDIRLVFLIRAQFQEIQVHISPKERSK